jgi:hypothetical protein
MPRNKRKKPSSLGKGDSAHLVKTLHLMLNHMDAQPQPQSIEPDSDDDFIYETMSELVRVIQAKMDGKRVTSLLQSCLHQLTCLFRPIRSPQ